MGFTRQKRLVAGCRVNPHQSQEHPKKSKCMTTSKHQLIVQKMFVRHQLKNISIKLLVSSTSKFPILDAENLKEMVISASLIKRPWWLDIFQSQREHGYIFIITDLCLYSYASLSLCWACIYISKLKYLPTIHVIADILNASNRLRNTLNTPSSNETCAGKSLI